MIFCFKVTGLIDLYFAIDGVLGGMFGLFELVSDFVELLVFALFFVGFGFYCASLVL